MIDNNNEKLKQVELNMLKEIDHICQNNNIKYFLMYGSLIGAVRHNGFIPWDDDIDIMMTRDNYNKFIKISQNLLPQSMFLQNVYSEHDLFRVHSQVRLNNTTMLIQSDYGYKYHKGIFIDIFVCDKVPVDEAKYIAFRKKINMKKKLISFAYLKPKLNLKTIIKRCIGHLYCVAHFGKRNAFRKFEKYASKFSKLQDYYYADVVFRSEGRKRLFEKESIEKNAFGIFEGLSLPIPYNAISILKTEYGDDVMTPKRECTTHGGIFYDLDKSYKEYETLSKEDFCNLFV